MVFIGLNAADLQKLEYEIISDKARLKLTRLIRFQSQSEDVNVAILKQNRFVNIANNAMGRPIYVLSSDDSGDYLAPEHAWHIGEIELIMRRPNTKVLVEILADMLQENLLEYDKINEILREDGCSVSYEKNESDGSVEVNILEIDALEDAEVQDNHPNIRLLVKRMDTALQNCDYSGVLHASASILETLAKIVVSLSSVENKPLGSFFERYRIDSGLPSQLLDYIFEIYNQRNVVPTAGHGGTITPEINKQQAIVLAEMTKTLVKIERKLSMETISISEQ